MNQSTRIPISDLNSNLTCMLCGGYYIDAVTIIECLHSFCRTCLVRFLQTSKFCPVCDVMIHKTKPLCNIRSDKTLQNLVYKLVPGLYKNEMKRRREYYQTNTSSKEGREESAASPPPNMANGTSDRVPHDDPLDARISLSLHLMSMETLSAPPPESEHPVKYLQCPPAFTIAHMKKFIRLKYDLPSSYHIDVYHSDESLDKNYTLLDVANIYRWQRRAPLRLHYTICEKTARRHNSASSRSSSIASSDTITSRDVSNGAGKNHATNHAETKKYDEKVGDVPKGVGGTNAVKRSRGRPAKSGLDASKNGDVKNDAKRKVNTPAKKLPQPSKKLVSLSASKSAKGRINEKREKTPSKNQAKKAGQSKSTTPGRSRVTPAKRKAVDVRETPTRSKARCLSTPKEKSAKDGTPSRRRTAKKVVDFVEKESQGKKNATLKDDSKKDESKRDEAKRDEAKRDETKRDETKRDESKRDESKRDESKRDDLKKDIAIKKHDNGAKEQMVAIDGSSGRGAEGSGESNVCNATKSVEVKATKSVDAKSGDKSKSDTTDAVKSTVESTRIDICSAQNSAKSDGGADSSSNRADKETHSTVDARDESGAKQPAAAPVVGTSSKEQQTDDTTDEETTDSENELVMDL